MTPPGHGRYSIDKYVSRDELPFPCDDGLFEVRILTVSQQFRASPIAFLLMYAALRWIQLQRGTRIVAIGRLEVLGLYLKLGLNTLGRTIRSGAVKFKLMTADMSTMNDRAFGYSRVLRRLQHSVDWQLPTPFLPTSACMHGGAFFDGIGVEFDDLDRRRGIINADVLDAWYPPAPEIVDTLKKHLDWALQTSPPTDCEGMVQTIAHSRDIPAECVVPGAGSSHLIFLAFHHWLMPASRVLILDPTYGEYPHVLERLIGCHVDRFELRRSDNYDLNLEHFERRLQDGYDLAVLVNPNSPTGRHVSRADLENILRNAPQRTRFWIDETYVDYAGPDESLERFAAHSQNVIVCKSMSKIYALSGVRAAYLCAPVPLANMLRSITPPWAVGLPAQIAAVMALKNPRYYRKRHRETHRLRETLAGKLTELSFDVVPAVANFLLCHLPDDGPDAATLLGRCREQGLYLRDVSPLSRRLGTRTVRIAVKDADTNRQMIGILEGVLNARPRKKKTHKW